MTSKIKLNGSDSVNYLIHGQELYLEFHFPSAWFVSLYYNHVPNGQVFRKRPTLFWQRYRWFSKKGAFKSTINGFYPVLRITHWSPFPKRMEIPLTVNHVYLSNPLPSFTLNTYHPIPKVSLSSIGIINTISDFKPNFESRTVAVSELTSAHSVLKNSFETYRNNYPKNQI